MDRRSLIKNAGIAGVLAAGIAPAVHAQAAVRWRLASSFPTSLDTIFGSAEVFSKTVKATVGRQVPDLGARRRRADARLRRGRRRAERHRSKWPSPAAYYFSGKDPTFAFGCAVPFGLNTRQMTRVDDTTATASS